MDSASVGNVYFYKVNFAFIEAFIPIVIFVLFLFFVSVIACSKKLKLAGSHFVVFSFPLFFFVKYICTEKNHVYKHFFYYTFFNCCMFYRLSLFFFIFSYISMWIRLCLCVIYILFYFAECFFLFFLYKYFRYFLWIMYTIMG